MSLAFGLQHLFVSSLFLFRTLIVVFFLFQYDIPLILCLRSVILDISVVLPNMIFVLQKTALVIADKSRERQSRVSNASMLTLQKSFQMVGSNQILVHY